MPNSVEVSVKAIEVAWEMTKETYPQLTAGGDSQTRSQNLQKTFLAHYNAIIDDADVE